MCAQFIADAMNVCLKGTQFANPESLDADTGKWVSFSNCTHYPEDALLGEKKSSDIMCRSPLIVI
jgi:hypothetical protein